MFERRDEWSEIDRSVQMDFANYTYNLKCMGEGVVDLEHNQYQYFQGLTWFMHIPTRTKNFITDNLKLRVYMDPYFRGKLKEPSWKIIMYEANWNTLWHRRSFGICRCNLLDTGQSHLFQHWVNSDVDDYQGNTFLAQFELLHTLKIEKVKEHFLACMKWEWKETQVEAEGEEGSHQAKPSYLDSLNRKNKIHGSQNNHLWIFFLRLSKELISGGSDGVFMIWGERQGLHGSLELVTNQSMKAHDGGVVAILLYRVIGGSPHLITISADNTLAIWDINKSSNRLRVYCMVAHPLKPHLVATGTNGGIIVSEFDSRSLIHVTPLLMSVESRDDSAICIHEDELRLLNLHLSNTTEPSHGKLYGDSFQPLCMTQTKKRINAPISLDAYSVLSVSSSRKYVAVVWPGIPCLSIEKVTNWSIVDLGSARLLAWDTYGDRFAILESTIPPRMPIIHKESF
ncbi:hypothetical protein V6N12_016059 [Hibiscus sabdariffa]